MLINGQPATQIALADRGLAYGDGLFETIRYQNGRLLFVELHLQRLTQGCERLGLELDLVALERELTLALDSSNPAVLDKGVLKLMVTRGAGGRGYRPPQQAATRIITLHALPEYPDRQPEAGIKAFVCRQTLAEQPLLAGLKHLNRLEQVLASREWPDESYLEGLMLNPHGQVVEGTRSNIFFVHKGGLKTPDLGLCGVNGIMRQVLVRHFGVQVETGNYSLAQLCEAEEVFFCNSVFGVWPLLTLRHHENDFHWQAGTAAKEAAQVFSRALQA